MAEFVHSSYKKNSYINQIVNGKWVPYSEDRQYLVYYQTHLEIYGLSGSYEVPQLIKLFEQRLFIKISAVCAGPLIKDVCSALVLTKNCFFQMFFSTDEGLFTTIKKITLPELCFNANFIHYFRSSILISAPNGGMCSFSSISYEIRFSCKPTNCVYQIFKHSFNEIIRIESGPTISRYGSDSSRCIESIYNEDHIVYAFSFGFEHIVICFNDKVISYSNEGSIEIIFPNDFYETNDTIISHTEINIGTWVLLSKNFNLYLLLASTEVFLLSSFDGAGKLLPLDSDYIIIQKMNGNCFLYNVETNQTRLWFESSACRFFQRILSPSRVYSLVDNSISQEDIGIRLKSSKIVPIPQDFSKLFGLVFNGASYFLGVFQGNSSLYSLSFEKITDKQIDINENAETIGIITFGSSDKTCLIQIWKTGFTVILGSKSKNIELENEIVSDFTFNNDHGVILLSNRVIYLVSFEHIEINIHRISIIEQATVIAIPQHSSDFILFGNQEGMISSYKLRAKSTLNHDIIFKNIHNPILSLTFLDSEYFVIGLENSFMILKFTAHEPSIDTMIHVPCGNMIPKFFLSANFLLLNGTVSWIIRVMDKKPIIMPMASQIVGDVVFCRSEYHIYTFTQSNVLMFNELSSSSIEKIIKFEDPVLNYWLVSESKKLLLCLAKCVLELDTETCLEKVLFRFPDEQKYIMSSYRESDKCLVWVSEINYGCQLYYSNYDNYSGLEHIFTCFHQSKVNIVCIYMSGFIVVSGFELYFYYILNGMLISDIKIDFGSEISEVGICKELLYAYFSNGSIEVFEFNGFDFVKLVQYDSILNATFVCPFSGFMAVSDLLGNIALTELKNTLRRTQKKISISMGCNIGDIITSLESRHNFYDYILYRTISGSSGFIMQLPHIPSILIKANFLLRVQNEIANKLIELTQIDYTSFRFMHVQSSNILDLDLVEVFWSLSNEQQKNICSALSPASDPSTIYEIFWCIKVITSYYLY